MTVGADHAAPRGPGGRSAPRGPGARRAAQIATSAAPSRLPPNQGLTLVHFSAQPEPLLTRNAP
jgi:hypothetical protein